MSPFKGGFLLPALVQGATRILTNPAVTRVVAFVGVTRIAQRIFEKVINSSYVLGLFPKYADKTSREPRESIANNLFEATNWSFIAHFGIQCGSTALVLTAAKAAGIGLGLTQFAPAFVVMSGYSAIACSINRYNLLSFSL